MSKNIGIFKYLSWFLALSFTAIVTYWVMGGHGVALSLAVFFFGMGYVVTDSIASFGKKLMLIAVNPKVASYFTAWTFYSVVMTIWMAFIVYGPFSLILLVSWMFMVAASFVFVTWRVKAIMKQDGWESIMKDAVQILKDADAKIAAAKVVGNGT